MIRRLTILGCMLAFVACTQGNKNIDVKTDAQKVSYAIGQQIGRQMKTEGLEVDVDVLAMSIRDALAGKDSRVPMPDLQMAMQKMQETMTAKQQGAAKDNKTKGDKFLEDNKKNKNVKVTKSGLQYEVIQEGKGEKPKASDTVRVHYKGTLLDGSEFDSSYKRNEPAEFPVNGVIPGWTEALLLMNKGSKYKLYIPGELAYGEQGRPGIPPNSMLTFEVELLDINPKDKPKDK